MQSAPRVNRVKIFDRSVSQTKIIDKKEVRQSKNVKFSDKLIDSPQSRKKHRSASILKKRTTSSLQKGGKNRSDSVNSMASQGPLDDQSCENSYLNKSIKQEYAKLVQITKKKGNKYTDDIFPPVISSLFSFAGRKKNKYPNVKWMRLTQVFGGKQFILFDNEESKLSLRPSTNLSSQYFSNGLNCIKNSKSLLRKMFEDQKINQFGIYYVKLFQANVWKYIIIDDCIPVLESEQQNIQARPVFITFDQSYLANNKVELWPFLLEKALAKYYSSYQCIQPGNIFDFLEQLTNKTCEQYSIQNQKTNEFKQVFGNPDVIVFGQTKQSVKVPFLINSPQKISFSLQNKQKYTITANDLQKYFSRIYAIGSKSYNYVGQCPIRQAKQSVSVRQFTIKNTCFCSLSLNQKDKRFFQEHIKYQYRWIRMIIMLKQFNGGYRWIDGRYDNQKTLSIESQFQPGDYYVVLMPEWGERSYDLTLIIRSKVPVRLERKPYQQGMIEEACADLAQRYGRLNQLNTYICSYNCIHEDLGLIIENINNQRVKGQIKILRSIDGLKSKVQIEAVNKQFQKSKTIQVIIKHNSHYTVVLKMKGGVDRQFFQTFDFGGR